MGSYHLKVLKRDHTKIQVKLIIMKFNLLLLSSVFAFPENKEKSIRDLVQEINDDPRVTWKAGFNTKFSPEKRPADFAYLMGTLETPHHLRLPEKEIIEATEIPTEFNSRDEWGAMCPSLYEIRDQGNCGSCWAFGAAEAFTDRACIQSNGAINVDLSTEDLLSCCRNCGFGCDGGYLGPSWTYFQTRGICTGGLYEGTGCRPYSIEPCEHHVDGDRTNCADMPDAPTPSCTKSCGSSYTENSYSDDMVKASSSYSVGNFRQLAQIQTEIMTNGPVEVSYTVYEDFMAYTSGVYYHQSGKSLGGHAVKFVGWGVDEDTGLDYWLVANSWNSDWGEAGDFRIRRGTNECGIENSAVAGMVDV